MIDAKPLILITNDSNARTKEPGERRQIVSPKAYAEAISAAGGVPVLTVETSGAELLRLCDGLLLTGGDDVDPDLFGETVWNDTVFLDYERTAFEVPLIRAALKNATPILAICRGFQLLSCLLGGGLVQDLPSQRGLQHRLPGGVHAFRAEPGSILETLFGGSFLVNSTHHQAVSRLGTGLIPAGYAGDGLLEAYVYERLPILGVQFHPEALTGAGRDTRTPDFAPLFEAFIRICASRCDGGDGEPA